MDRYYCELERPGPDEQALTTQLGCSETAFVDDPPDFEHLIAFWQL